MSTNEWYTPAKYIEAARTVMGGIDLDPASCEIANKTVKAMTYYSKEQNGLMQPWYGRVWCNPPYGRTKGNNAMSHQQAFAEKLQREFIMGKVEDAILLSLGNPGSLWFQPLFDYIICYHRGHIHFDRPDGTVGDFGFPLAFVYFGPNEQLFIDTFSKFGRIVRAIDTPPVQPIAHELWEIGA